MIIPVISSYNSHVAYSRQESLFCPDCGGLPAVAGLCGPCYRQRRHSAQYFAGIRDQVLARDRYQCQGCGAGNQRPVHHRRPGVHDRKWLVTICPSCHAVIHKLQAHRRWLPDFLLTLWREQHPAVPLQGQLDIGDSVPLSGRGGGAATW